MSSSLRTDYIIPHVGAGMPAHRIHFFRRVCRCQLHRLLRRWRGKMHITLPRRLLAKIDEYARSHGETRSGFLAEAARAAMR